MRRPYPTPDPQATLVYDAAAADTLKHDGIRRAAAGAGNLWLDSAASVLHLLCRNTTRDELTTDDLWSAMARYQLAVPSEPRALGAVMLRGAREGWLKKTDRVRPSERSNCHGRPIAVWTVTRRV